MARTFFRSLTLLISLNLLVKPLWIFAIDRQVQNVVGHATYGAYFALLNLTLVLNILMDLGITSFFNRTIAARELPREELFARAFTGKIMLTGLYMVVVLAIALLSGIRDIALLSSLILLQVFTGFNMFFRGYLSATQHFTEDAIVSVTDKFLVILVAGALILYPRQTGGIGISSFIWIQIGALACSISLGIFLLYRNLKGRWHFSFKGFDNSIFLDSLPYALNIFLMGFMSRTDGFLLERMRSDGAVHAGIYATGYRLLDAVNMVGFLFAGFLLPYIARHWPDRKTVEQVFLLSRHFLVVTGAIAAGFVAAAPYWTDSILYNDVTPFSAQVLSLLMLCLPFLSLTQVYGTLLTAILQIRTLLTISAVFTLLNLLLNLVLIPRYGALGSAIAALVTQSGYAITLYVVGTRKTGLTPAGKELMLSFGAGLVVFFAVRALQALGWPLIPGTLVTVTVVVLLFLRMMKITRSRLVTWFADVKED